MAGREQIEPPSELREAAASCWQMFVALTQEGFSEKQALEIIGHMMRAGMSSG
jgi:hypothetical protein